MPKFYGKIGYGIMKETAPGVWIDEVVERSCTGDVLKNTQRWTSTANVNPDVTISDRISIIADGFTLENISTIKYVVWRGAKWAVNTIIVERPRVILEIGGVYSG